jgi:hypothetical protein
MPECPSPAKREVGEVRRVVPTADSERDPVARNRFDPRDYSGQGANRLGRGLGEFSVADLDEQGGKAHCRSVVGRFVSRLQTKRNGLIVQETQGRNHPPRIGGNESAGATSDLGARSRISEGMNRQARNVSSAPVDGREDEGRS